MPEYLFQAVHPDGRRVNEQIEAPDLDRARYTLEVRGYRDILFFDSEISDDVKRQIRADTGIRPPDKEIWTPDEQVRSRQRRGIPAFLWWAFCQHFVVIGPLLAWNVWSLVEHAGALTRIDWLGFIATPLYLAWFVLRCMPKIVFNQILDAAVWHDWDRQRFFIRLARGLKKLITTAIPERELKIREANALAARGRLGEALQLMEKVRAAKEGKEYLFLARLGSVYEFAGAYDRLITCRREAQQKGPAGASMSIDLAVALVQRGHDVAGAKEALAQAKNFEMNKTALAFCHWCEGMIAVEEKDFARAKADLAAARDLLATGGSRLTLGTIGIIEAYLCIACGRLGEKDEAVRLGRKVEPLLRARKETDLLQRCQAAMGGV